MVLLYRFLLEGEGSGYQKIQARKDRRKQKLTYAMIFRLYGTRIIGTGGCWCLWDICFYGLKLVSVFVHHNVFDVAFDDRNQCDSYFILPYVPLLIVDTVFRTDLFCDQP